MDRFTVIGENLHCTRAFKRSGKRVVSAGDEGAAITYRDASDREQRLPIPKPFLEGADWEQGKVKHCAVAIWQGLYGDAAGRSAGADYLRSMARMQEAHDASFLDINVDELSTDVDERVRALTWAAEIVQAAGSLPLSIDSSNETIMRAGLEAADPSRGRPMINSISLERIALLPVVGEYKPAVVASAAGETSLPCGVEDRLENIRALVSRLTDQGIALKDVYVDPLVYTVSTDPENGRRFLEAVTAIREAFGPDIHIVGGLSNVSFGMPARRLINEVFADLSVQAGGDGGIVDPRHINRALLEALDRDSQAYALAKAMLVGEDPFGMNFISAYREGALDRG